MNIHRTFTFIIILLLTAACSSEETGNQQGNNANQGRPGGGQGDFSPTVEATQARFGGLPLEERLSGVVRAKNQTDIYPEINAPIVEVLVRDGDAVEKGQPLVRLRDTEARERLRQAQSGLNIVEAQVRQAQTNLRQAQSAFDRAKTLSERALTSALELETLEAQLESADASLSLVRAQRDQARSVVTERVQDLERTIVKSPISGVVGQRSAEVGQQVNQNTRLFIVGDLSSVEVSIPLTERMLAYIKTGQTAAVYSQAMRDTLIRAQLSRISPFLDPVSHTTTGQLDIPNEGGLLRPGMFVTVDVFYGESDHATLVPNNAIYNHPREGTRGIFVVTTAGTDMPLPDDANLSGIFGPFPVRFVPVEIIAEGRMISGVRGINNGDWVVTVGQNLLATGRRQARFRPMQWERMLNLQDMQSQDLIRLIQQKLAEQQSELATTDTL